MNGNCAFYLFVFCSIFRFAASVTPVFYYGETNRGVSGTLRVDCPSGTEEITERSTFLPHKKCVHSLDPYFGYMKATLTGGKVDDTFDLEYRCDNSDCTGCQTKKMPQFYHLDCDGDSCESGCMNDGSCSLSGQLPFSESDLDVFFPWMNVSDPTEICNIYFIPDGYQWYRLSSDPYWEYGRIWYKGAGCVSENQFGYEKFLVSLEDGDSSNPDNEYENQGEINDCLAVSRNMGLTKYFRSSHMEMDSVLSGTIQYTAFLYDDLINCTDDDLNHGDSIEQLTNSTIDAWKQSSNCFDLDNDVDASFHVSYPYNYECFGEPMVIADKVCHGDGICLTTEECDCDEKSLFGDLYLRPDRCDHPISQAAGVGLIGLTAYTLICCFIQIFFVFFYIIIPCLPVLLGCFVLVNGGLVCCFACVCCCCCRLGGGDGDLTELEILRTVQDRKKSFAGRVSSKPGSRSTVSARKAASINWDQLEAGDDDGDSETPQFAIKRDLFVIEYEEVKLIKIIGKGGGGTVYLGNWNDSEVAIKLFKTNAFNDSHDFTEFEREVKVMGSISHPNVLRFFGCLIKVPRVGIVMEYASKGDLERYFQNEEAKFMFRDKVRVMLGVCKGMSYLHERDIIHRDLKLQNVLMDENEVPKLIDFGLSRIINRNQKEAMTRRVGTSYYMAPEVTLGTDYDEKVDVFSFGIMLYIMVFLNFHPYGRNAEVNVEVQVASNPSFRPRIPLNCLFPEWILELMSRCWSHEADKRPSFDEIIKEVEEHKDDTEGPDEILMKQETKIKELEKNIEKMRSKNEKIRGKILKGKRKKGEEEVVEADSKMEKIEEEVEGEGPVPVPISYIQPKTIADVKEEIDSSSSSSSEDGVD